MVFLRLDMLPILDSRVSFDGNGWRATCQCGSDLRFSCKNNALKMLHRGTCRNCKRDYRSVNDESYKIHKAQNGKWASYCSGCGMEQQYTRKDHAKQSSLQDWQCKKCVAKAKGFSKNRRVGSKQRMFNRFKKSAKARGLKWNLTLEQIFLDYNGVCCLTGEPISIDYDSQTASLDRIDSSKGYEVGNIQWVLSDINMMKRNMEQRKFIELCKKVSKRSNS